MKTKGRRESTHVIDARRTPTPQPSTSGTLDRENPGWVGGYEDEPRTRPAPSRTPTPAELGGNVTRTILRGTVKPISKKR